MKKSIQLFAFVTLVTLTIASCGGSGDMSNASPREVLVAFSEKMSKQDIDGAAKLATSESQFMLNTLKNVMSNPEFKEKAKDQDMTKQFSDVEIGEAVITGDDAVVPIKSKKESFELKMPLKKENGAWKVHMTIASMMNADMKKDGQSVLTEEQKKMTPADIEKAREDIQKAMEMADSGMKQLTPEQKKYLKDVIDKANEKHKQEQK